MKEIFAKYTEIPLDPIFALSQEAAADSRPHKVDLTIGIYKDINLQSIVFKSVKKSEKALFSEEINKDYLSIAGSRLYVEQITKLVLGQCDKTVCGIQSLGGTGALYLGGRLVARRGTATVWISNPSWINHRNIFSGCGFTVRTYPYYDRKEQKLLFPEFCETISQAQPGDIVVVHGCCHNPSGADLSAQQWKELSKICREKELIPIFDLAYQGFGDGLEEDVAGVRQFASDGHAMLIASSLSKNFGLYGERTGTLLVISPKAHIAHTHLQAIARASYSNPPRHGALLVEHVLSDAALRSEWETELEHMRVRMQKNRNLLANQLMAAHSSRDYAYLKERKGMFCYLDLTPEQVEYLKKEKAIYLTGTGRINVSGLNENNLSYVVESICALAS